MLGLGDPGISQVAGDSLNLLGDHGISEAAGDSLGRSCNKAMAMRLAWGAQAQSDTGVWEEAGAKKSPVCQDRLGSASALLLLMGWNSGRLLFLKGILRTPLGFRLKTTNLSKTQVERFFWP